MSAGKEKIIIIDDGSIGSQLLEKEYSEHHDIEKVKAENLDDLLKKIAPKLKDDKKIFKIFTHYCLEEYTDQLNTFVNLARDAYPNVRIANKYMGNPKAHIENRAKKYGISSIVKETIKEKQEEGQK